MIMAYLAYLIIIIIIVMAFSPPVVGCLVKKGLQKGGSRAPQDPPGYAYVF